MGCFSGRRPLDFIPVRRIFFGGIIFVLFLFPMIAAGEVPAEAQGMPLFSAEPAETPPDAPFAAVKDDGRLYVPGQLVVKFRDGKTPEDVKELNAKYHVVSWERVFEGIPSPRRVLDELKKKLSILENRGSQGWYWQLDKNSPEYKVYLEKEEMEKKDLRDHIRIQEDVLAHTDPEHDQAARDAINSGTENLYFLKSEDHGTDILAMAAEYQVYPPVESADPNYIAKVQ